MGHRSLHLRFSLLAALAALGVVVLSGTAAAAAVGCGDTLTKSTTLTNDVTGCPGDGLHIGADGITLDLNGHTISAATPTADGSKGIDFAGHGHVTVERGVVRGFADDVFVNGSDDAVEHMKEVGFTDRNGDRSSTGVETLGDRDSVGANTVSGTQNGVTDLGGAGCSITYSTASDNDTGFANGTCTVSHNTATGNDAGFQVGGGTVTTNTANGNRVGFSIFASGATIQGNVSNGNGIGFDDQDSGGDLIKANRAQSNTEIGMLLAQTFGERLIDNVVGSENPNAGGAGGNGSGIVLFGMSQASSNQNVLDGNSVNWNTGDGIAFGPNVFDTTLTSNVANRNGGDGLSGSGGGLVQSNNAKYDQGYGMRFSGMTDGGNNHAFGNVLGQCLGVSCTP